jgi:hypothetical protein
MQALNVSSEASADQVGEQIYSLDANDKHLDEEARSTASEEAIKMEGDASKQFQDVIDSFNVKVASLIETEEPRDDEDALRTEISILDQELSL